MFQKVEAANKQVIIFIKRMYMRKLRVLVLWTLAMIGNVVVAQNTDANIFGHVIDKQTREHLPFVNVVVKGTTKGASTDFSSVMGTQATYNFKKAAVHARHIGSRSRMGHQPPC